VGRYKWIIIALIILLVVGIFVWFKGNEKPLEIGRRDELYTIQGQVSKWFAISDTIEAKIGNKTVSLKLSEYPEITIIGPNPKDRLNTTILIKSQYTSQEWGRAFCEGDVLLIGTKENNWTNLKNYMQITPDFVNVEDRVCYNSQSAN